MKSRDMIKFRGRFKRAEKTNIFSRRKKEENISNLKPGKPHSEIANEKIYCKERQSKYNQITWETNAIWL